MKSFFFPSFFFVCGHGDVGLSQCSVSKEEATFLSCMRHFLCVEKSRSLFFFFSSNLCSVGVSPDVFPAGESRTGPSEMEAAAEGAVLGRFHLLPLEAEIKPGRVGRRNVTDTQLNGASVTHHRMSH